MSEKQCVNCPGRTDHTTAECWVRDSLPDGYMPIPTAEQLADALENVRCFHDMSAELIAPELLANLLESTAKAWESLPVGVPDGYVLVPVEPTPEMSAQTAYNGTHYSDPFDFEDFKKDYAAMLAAAPAAPTVKAEQVRCTTCQDSGIVGHSDVCPECQDTWQPAPSLPAAGSAGEEVEVVGWQDAENPLYTTAERRVMHEWVANQYPIVELMTVAQHERIVAALSAQQSAHVSVPRELLEDLVAHVEGSTCTHDNTHRGGSIWEICDDCGDSWADDRGGKPAFKWPDCVEKARALLNGGEA